MKSFKRFLFAGLILAIFLISCGERQYALTGILTFNVVDEEEKPLKKEQAERFELYPINDYQYVVAEIKVKDEKYLVYETTCYDILKGKFDLYNSLKDINPPLNRIIKLKGVILVDKLGEYKTQSYYFDTSNFDELNSGTVDHLIYQIKSTIKLEKKD